ncbi:hypothetical protein LAT59_04085 [Candidatus Gracilibacteria bacterium]|nr:hypothetical protein [Candidatus Gracilibacteria bacterium]
MKKVNFAIREIGELYTLEFLISEFQRYGIQWNIYTIPYNSDLREYDASSRLSKYEGVSVINGEDGVDVSCVGFQTDISGRFEDRVKSCIDVYQVATCMDMDFGIDLSKFSAFDIVVSNVKINDKKPEKEYDPRMWEMLGKLPYSIAVGPRHPFPDGYLTGIEIPDNVTVINQIGQLKGLCAKTSLTVMGLIFSNPEGEMDHSPLEATLNSNTISGTYGEIEDAYKDFYVSSGLVHQYGSFVESMGDIEGLINDPYLEDKLENKRKWIRNNRGLYMPEILDILLDK